MTAHDCPRCGDRCSVCDDRMCATNGPEPMPRCTTHAVCTDCCTTEPPADCAACDRAIAEAARERAAEVDDRYERSDQ